MKTTYEKVKRLICSINSFTSLISTAMIMKFAAQYCNTFTFIVKDKTNFPEMKENERILSIILRTGLALYFVTIAIASTIGAEAHATVNLIILDI